MTAGILTNIAVVGGLEDYQFELNGYRFGLDCPIFVDENGFDPGSNGWMAQDQQSSITGATRMGRDVRSAQVWQWMLHSNAEDDVELLAELQKMGQAWLAGDRDARTVHMLRYRVGGRTRVIFGRPRSFDYKPGRMFYAGALPPTATFAKADALHYDDEEQGVDMRLHLSSPGGFSWPATFPLTFTRDGEYVPPWGVIVGGDAPTAPIVVFHGPVTDPSVRIGDYKLSLRGFLPEGGRVRVDARPWSMDVTRSGPRGSIQLTSDVRLTSARLEPGAYDAIFTGVDNTGTARCQILWRNAWHTL